MKKREPKPEIPLSLVGPGCRVSMMPSTPRGERRKEFSLNGNPRRKAAAYGKGHKDQ